MTEIKLPYSEPEFSALWAEWVEYRKEIKKPYKSPKSIERQLNWFVRHKLSVIQAMQCIEESIRNQWQGIWLPKHIAYGHESNKQSGQPSSPGNTGTSTNRTDALKRW